MKTEEQKVNYLTRLFEETYLKDIIERHDVKKTQELDDLVNVLASAAGSLTNVPKIAATFKTVLPFGHQREHAATVYHLSGRCVSDQQGAALQCEGTEIHWHAGEILF